MKKEDGDKRRTFEFMRVKRLSKDQVLCKHHILHYNLEEGNFFGRRALLSEQDVELSD